MVVMASQSVSLKLLALLAEADVKGRICDDKEDLLQRIEFFKGEAQRLGFYDNPFVFESDAARFLYFSKEHMSLMYKPYEEYNSEVVLMSGLPGAGKDYWLERNLPDLSVISLDDIRHEMNISPEDKQHKVINRAKEEARECCSKVVLLSGMRLISPGVCKNSLSIFFLHIRQKLLLCI